MTKIEIDSAIWVGTQLWRASHSDGRSDRDEWVGFQGEGGQRRQCLGSLCERIAAKALGIYWPSAFDNFSEADLPHNIEVRLVGREHYGVRVYPRNDDSRRVLGVVVPPGLERAGRYRVCGWTLAGDAKVDDFQIAPHGRPPMYAFPQPLLRPVAELRRMCAGELAGRA